MDETRVENDIEVAGAAQLIAGQADWELRELHTFTRTILLRTAAGVLSGQLKKAWAAASTRLAARRRRPDASARAAGLT
jgi:hypothetical protein